jgi:lipopolysaccharide/colanic/teichoic acid biosynthesis glycosyltransferase
MPEPITIMVVAAGGGGVLWELARRQFRIFKELMDMVGGVIGLMLFGPVMLICAAMIKLADPAGPVMYRQVRVGRNGRLFTIFKLRTMYMDAEAHGKVQWAGKDDPRVIGICRWMRRSHMDELPQLINILRAEMSMVGPRPERPEMFESLTAELPDYEKRLAVKPGLTGLAQINVGYDVDMNTVRRKLEMDLEYIETMSLGMDVKVIAATVGKFNDRSAR